VLSQDPTVCSAIPLPWPTNTDVRKTQRRFVVAHQAGAHYRHPTPHGSHPPNGDAFVVLLRKEVIQPHLPVRLPCYDFVPIADPTFDSSPHKGWATGFGCYRLS
jgi:hypothetical protein